MPEEPVGPASGAERRASVRYPCDPESFSADNTCRPLTARRKDESWTATVRDLSTGGVGIVVNRRFEPGTLLSIELQDADRLSARTLLVRVVRLTKEGKEHWLLGCAFTTKLSEAELLALM
ncbi:MAG: PilZ domain-containing protein [Gemmataceae bacterium]|nr:PilZ domain-containing protein [Gemmataceae bacterium]